MYPLHPPPPPKKNCPLKLYIPSCMVKAWSILLCLFLEVSFFKLSPSKRIASKKSTPHSKDDRFYLNISKALRRSLHCGYMYIIMDCFLCRSNSSPLIDHMWFMSNFHSYVGELINIAIIARVIYICKHHQ